VKLGCDHTNYPSHVELAANTLASLAGDILWTFVIFNSSGADALKSKFKNFELHG
jgi:hypothetical protein